MAITVTVDFTQHIDGLIEFRVLYDLPEASTLHFPALVVGKAILLEAAAAHYLAIVREIASILDTSPDQWTALNEALHEFSYILYRDDLEVRIIKAR